jgi:ATP-dependent Zn protease
MRHAEARKHVHKPANNPQTVTAMARQQKRMSKIKIETAYHEAGHAVAAIVFGYLADSDFLTIVAKDNILGCVSHLPPLMQGCQNKKQMRSLVEQMCIGLYAGFAAQRLVDPNAPEFHGEDDEIQAWNLPKDHGFAPRGCQFIGDDVYERYLYRLKRKAERFVKMQRPVIDALAAALLKRKSMTGAEAMEIVKPLLR